MTRLLVGLILAVASFRSVLFCGWTTPPRARSVQRNAWFEVAPGQKEFSPQGRAWPVFPSPSVLWPGAHVQFAVIEPGHRQLYEALCVTSQEERHGC
ncbi:unnamed protein product [Effrenium voratum]|nr:unnamed protein product [Effrenium voratum]